MKNITAAEFNAKYPTGTRVNYHRLLNGSTHQPTRTRSEAWELGHGVTVVKVNGKLGCVTLESLTVGCRDEGTCHHQCGAGACFREDGCFPLSVSGASDWSQVPETAL